MNNINTIMIFLIGAASIVLTLLAADSAECNKKRVTFGIAFIVVFVCSFGMYYNYVLGGNCG
jgi:hypothetical protein